MRYVRTLWSVHFSAFCNVSFEVYLHLSLYLYLYFIRNENCSVAPRFLEDMSRPSRPLQQPVGVAMPVVPPPRPVGPPSMSLGHPALPFGPRGYNAGPLAQDLGQYGPIGQPVPHRPSAASGAWERLKLDQQRGPLDPRIEMLGDRQGPWLALFEEDFEFPGYLPKREPSSDGSVRSELLRR